MELLPCNFKEQNVFNVERSIFHAARFADESAPTTQTAIETVLRPQREAATLIIHILEDQMALVEEEKEELIEALEQSSSENAKVRDKLETQIARLTEVMEGFMAERQAEKATSMEKSDKARKEAEEARKEAEEAMARSQYYEAQIQVMKAQHFATLREKSTLITTLMTTRTQLRKLQKAQQATALAPPQRSVPIEKEAVSGAGESAAAPAAAAAPENVAMPPSNRFLGLEKSKAVDVLKELPISCSDATISMGVARRTTRKRCSAEMAGQEKRPQESADENLKTRPTNVAVRTKPPAGSKAVGEEQSSDGRTHLQQTKKVRMSSSDDIGQGQPTIQNDAATNKGKTDGPKRVAAVGAVAGPSAAIRPDPPGKDATVPARARTTRRVNNELTKAALPSNRPAKKA